MTERDDLLVSISETIFDYRTGELPSPSPEHVNTFVTQFNNDSQLLILRELDHVLKNTYINQKQFTDFIYQILQSEKLTGGNPFAYWKSVNFLDIQTRGESQKVILELMRKCLLEKLNLNLDECGYPNGPYIYLDDVMFSGTHIGNDVEAWIKDLAPDSCKLEILLYSIHLLGQWQVKDRLKTAVKDSGKNIEIRYWRCNEIENRKSYRRDAGTLWPAFIPEDASVKAYIALPHKFPFETRPPGGNLGPFSSEESRQLLERVMLLAGLRIRSFCDNPKEILRPLGFSSFGLGFGSMIVTYRNCPNNCPLALWWGNPNENTSSPLSKWYPLLQRKVYEDD